MAVTWLWRLRWRLRWRWHWHWISSNASHILQRVRAAQIHFALPNEVVDLLPVAGVTGISTVKHAEEHGIDLLTIKNK
ncbi:hypothetical protein P5G65_03870 [Paenibacillus chondroitinus]|uniref:Uncharacterized protein n=1 Tax=Paenibacillus chondroitinus TaxID=59842 RepID=A0ABU6D5K6_9BACL|nr:MULTISPECIES: hypothetical protein [Paenibacillus]MCY9660122.1 hypothetical protein [Paenibacillus anseongense]MEB4793019.1 hypothetical protein [Paenibacillus chondroitinus]